MRIPLDCLVMVPGPSLAKTRFHKLPRTMGGPDLLIERTNLPDTLRTVVWLLSRQHASDLILSIFGGFVSYNIYLRCLLSLVVQRGVQREELGKQLRTIISPHREILIRLEDKPGSMYLGDQIGLDTWGLSETSSIEFFADYVREQYFRY